MFMILFIVLLAAWLFGWGALAIGSNLIHLLVVVAVIALILHVVRGRGARI